MKKRTFLKTASLSLVGCAAIGENPLKASTPSIAPNTSSKPSAPKRDIIADNKEAIDDIIASKKHLDTTSKGWPQKSHSGLFTIAHLSDIHTDIKRLQNFQQFVDHVESIDASICTGDFINNGSDEQFAAMKCVNFKKDFLPVVGNHDRDNPKADSKHVYQELRMNTNTGKLYYYQDYPAHHIRIIVLNQFDIERGAWINNRVEHYSQEQIDWFIRTLQDAQSKGLAVTIAMHTLNMDAMPEKNDEGFYQRHYGWEKLLTSVISGPIIEDIVHAFKTAGSIDKQYTYADVKDLKVTAKASFRSNGTFIAYMVGHKHADLIGYSKYHPDQLYLLMNTSCCVAHFGGSNYGESVSDLARKEDTKTEDCFNVYSFDIENKLVKVVRVGACMNDRMKERKRACFSFE